MDWKGLLLGFRRVSSDLSGGKLGVPSQLSPTGLFYKGTKDTFFSPCLQRHPESATSSMAEAKNLASTWSMFIPPPAPMCCPPPIALSTLVGVGVPV